MHVILTEIETRVLGALVEKSMTTPEYYPLTLNALTAACNQKSNRLPVVEYDTHTVSDALETLRDKGVIRILMGGDSRVPKYQHYFEEAFETSPVETAALCELMLRGAQTPGELRGRAGRFGFEMTIEDINATLEDLAAREMPLVVQLPRQAGRREARYAHLLAGQPEIADDTEMPAPAPAGGPTMTERLAQLETTVEALREAVAELRAQVAELSG